MDGAEQVWQRDVPRPPKRRRAWGVALTVLAAVVVIAVAAAFGGRALWTQALCANPVVIRVPASTDIASAMQEMAASFDNQQRDVSGHCGMVEVTEQDPAGVAAQLNGQAGAGAQPVDGWIPDSSLWLDLVHGPAVRATGVSVASSPLVFTMPRQLASRVAGPSGSGAGWNLLLPPFDGGPPASLGLRVQLPDPTSSSEGLAAFAALRRLVGGNSQARRDQLADVPGSVLTSGSAAQQQALSSLATLSAPPWNQRMVTVATEQAVESYNQANPGQPLTALYPAKGTFSMDYPYLTATTSPVREQVAEAFGQYLRSAQVKQAVRRLLFRGADGRPGPAGGRLGAAATVPAATAIGPAEATAAAQAWRRLEVGVRQLLMVDVSGAMDQPFGDQQMTPLQLMEQDTKLGMGLLPDNVQMGMWQYATKMNGSLPYQVVVPVGPLPGQVGLISRRQQFIQIGQVVRASPGKSAALYSSVLAAYRYMNQTYQPGNLNELIVVGSGTETAQGDISLQRLLAGLRSGYNPKRPVTIIAVTFGTNGDASALRQITDATHGSTFTVHQPSDIVSVFLDTAGDQLCLPNCGR